MPAAETNRDLLFGILALQNGFIDQPGLIAAFHVWSHDKTKPLAQVLEDRGDLAAPRRALLDALVDEHARQHDGDARISVADLSSTEAVGRALRAIDDEDLQATLSHVHQVRRGYDNPFAAPFSGSIDAEPTASYFDASGSVGRFRILRPHARGGLGAVLVALDSELNREVAFKQIQDAYADRPESRSRFVLEAEITGGLEHPGIVPVYSLGHDASGRPFYAMRFIKGDSFKHAVERYHRERGGRGPREWTLGLQKLLRRFLDVCNAIAYAHSRGVLHRDIKPGNIMVGQYGETLVVDWGLAKIVGSPESSGEATLRPTSASGSGETLPGSALGTPQFMSPEQASGRIDELGPRSDVYSLGATLYYALTGKPPFTGNDVGAMLQAVQRGEFEPPTAMKSEIPRPLEAICLKAMSTKPDDRYHSPRALADDLERWLADEPVGAFREPLLARTGRWMRRHRPLVAATAASVLIGLIGLGVVAAILTMKNRALDRQTRRAEKREQLAIAAVRRFRDAIVENPRLKDRPDLAPLRQTLLKEPLAFFDDLTADLRSEPSTRPDALGRLARASFDLAQTAVEIGDSADAIRGFQATIELLGSRAGDSKTPPESTRGLLANALANLGEQQRRSGAKGEAADSFGRARSLYGELMRREPRRADYRQGLAELKLSDANLQRDLGRLADALRLSRESYELLNGLEQAYPDGAKYGEKSARVLVNVGLLCRELGRPAEARAALEKARKSLEAMTNRHADINAYRVDLASVLDSLSSLGRESGRLEDLLPTQTRAVDVCRQLVDAAPSVTAYQAQLALAQFNLANLRMQLNRNAEAESGFEESRQAFERLVRTHPTVMEYAQRLATVLNSIGLLSQAEGRADKAQAALVESSRILERLIKGYPDVQSHRQQLAHCLIVLSPLHIAQGRVDDALASSGKAAELLSRLVREHPDVPEFSSNLGFAHHVSGYCEANRKRMDRANEHYKQATEAQRAAWNLNRRNSVYRNALMSHLEALAESNRDLKAAEESARAAREWVALAAGRPAALYDAACALSLCVPIADGIQSSSRYSDEAFAALKKAVAAGYRDLGHAAADPDLKPLRGRADFQILILDPIFPKQPFARSAATGRRGNVETSRPR
jgi:eukaryotic-like serine/threonine-protein kinase